MSRSFVKTILPIDAHIPAIVEAVERSSVAIVNGSAGSGKSTRILPALLDHLSADWRIYQTEPRPALVRSAALRILDEHRHLGWRPGLPVGYIAGSERHVLPASRAIILNDQSLVNLLSVNEISEPTLVIVDEAHVRSTQNDVLLGMLNLMLKINPELLRVVISSATAHVEAFEKFFGKAEVITIAGRQFPVTRRVFSSEDSVVSIADQLCDDAASFLQGTYTIDAPEFPQVTPSYGAVAAVLPGEDDVEYVAEEIRDSLLRDPEATVEQIPGGELIVIREKSVEILKDYRAFEDRIDAEARMRTDVPDDCLRVIVGTEIVRTGLTMKDLHEFHDCGLVKRLCDDHGVGKLEIQFISQAEVVQAEGRVGRLLPGRYNLYLPHDKNIADLVPYPESELCKQPLTRTVLAIRSAGYDPETFPFIDQVVEDANGLNKSFGERLKQAGHRLRNLGMITVEGSVTRLGQKMRSIKARPELAVAVWRGEDLGVLPEVLLAGAMIESGNNPFFHTKKELRFAPFETCEEVVRIVLAHCRCTDDGLGQIRAYYTRDLMVTEPERVSLERLPVWIRRGDQGLFTIDLVAEDGREYLTDRGRQELSLLVRRSFSQGSGSDFAAMVRACRAFAAARKQLKDEDAPRLASMSEEEIEEAARTRRHRLKQWCEHRCLNFSNLQAAWRQIGDLMSDVKRAGTVVPKDVAASRTFSAEHLLEALMPLLEHQIAVKLGAGTTYTIGSHLVEPSWQSVLREFYPLPQFALFADIRRGERRGEEHFFAEYAAPLELDRLLKLQPARWKIIAQPSNISTPKHVIEDVVLLDARRNQEVCRFRRERPHVQ